jgi:hypothetical protein
MLMPSPQREGWGDFPIEVFPQWAREWCEQLAHELQIAVDLPAITLLGVVAGCAGKALRVWRNAQWYEWPTLWTAVAYGSGEHKSAARARFVAPLEAFEKRQEETYLERLTTWLTTFAQLKEEINRLGSFLRELRTNESKVRRQIVLEEDEEKRRELEEQLGRIQEEQSKTLEQLTALKARYKTERADEPIRRRLLINDVTPVAMVRFLARNRAQGLVLDSEASFLDNVGRYGLQALPTLLSAESGDTITLDRANGEIVVRNPCVSVAVLPQPHVLEALARQRGVRERGLLARMLVVFAESRMGQRNVAAEPMQSEVQAGYMWRILRLLTWADLVRGPVDVVLSGAAQAVFARFHAEIEKRLGRGADLSDEELRSWGSKLPGRVLKIALVLHLLDYLEDAPNPLYEFGDNLPLEVGRQTVERTIKIARFVIPHQVAAFEAMLGGRVWGDARRILGWAAHARKTEFSGREARRSFSQAVQRSPECNARLAAALNLLLSMGRIVQKPVPEGVRKTGRPPSPVYTILPEHEAE